MENLRIKIIAETLGDFVEIEKRLKELPESVRNQVESASNSELMNCLECKFRIKSNSLDITYFIPKDIQKIVDFGSFIGIYTSNVFFRIEETSSWKISDYQISYVFTNI